jgi:hypothetical protein
MAVRVIGAVGVEPTTNGLKDPRTAQQLQTNTVTYKRISSDLDPSAVVFRPY